MRQGNKAIDSRLGADDDISAVSPVASIRAAAGNVFLPAEAQTAISSLARLNLDFYPVDEHVELPEATASLAARRKA
jgi:hypothetical protein